MLRLTAAALILFSCISPAHAAPPQPHLYIIAVDCSRSFWQLKMTSKQQTVSLPYNRFRAVTSGMKNCIDEISVITRESTFIKRVPNDSSDFIKQVDRQAIRGAVESMSDFVLLLLNSTGINDRNALALEKLRNDAGSLNIALTQNSYLKASEVKTGTPMNEEINPRSIQRIGVLTHKIEGYLNEFTRTVTVPSNVRGLKDTEQTIIDMLGKMQDELDYRANTGLDYTWVNRGVYGSLKRMHIPFYFIIGNQEGTSAFAKNEELLARLQKIVSSGIETGSSFSTGSDYALFLKRAVGEMTNAVNNWGEFDPDIGLAVTMVIIGDGMNDPLGTGEDTAAYDPSLLAPVKEVLPSAGSESPIQGVSWDNISQFRIKFVVPQKGFNQDVFQAWKQLLQGSKKNSRIQVNYYKFENLMHNNAIDRTMITDLLN